MVTGGITKPAGITGGYITSAQPGTLGNPLANPHCMGGLAYQGYGGTQFKPLGAMGAGAANFSGAQMRAFGPISKAATGFGGNNKMDDRVAGFGVGVLISIGFILWAATGFAGMDKL